MDKVSTVTDSQKYQHLHDVFNLICNLGENLILDKRSKFSFNNTSETNSTDFV